MIAGGAALPSALRALGRLDPQALPQRREQQQPKPDRQPRDHEAAEHSWRELHERCDADDPTHSVSTVSRGGPAPENRIYEGEKVIGPP
jgi:hypothetical protein